MDGIMVGLPTGQLAGHTVSWSIIRSYNHTNGKRFKFSTAGKAEQSFPVYKGKASTGLYVGCKVRRLRRFPINLPLASLRAYLSGKPCIRPPRAKEPLKTETTAPPPTDRKGKNKVGLRASKRQGQPPPKGRRTDGRRAAGYLRRKYRSLLGNFPSRNTTYR